MKAPTSEPLCQTRPPLPLGHSLKPAGPPHGKPFSDISHDYCAHLPHPFSHPYQTPSSAPSYRCPSPYQVSSIKSSPEAVIQRPTKREVLHTVGARTQPALSYVVAHGTVHAVSFQGARPWSGQCNKWGGGGEY